MRASQAINIDVGAGNIPAKTRKGKGRGKDEVYGGTDKENGGKNGKNGLKYDVDGGKDEGNGGKHSTTP